jgi:hypothetical protein
MREMKRIIATVRGKLQRERSARFIPSKEEWTPVDEVLYGVFKSYPDIEEYRGKGFL